MPEADYTLYTFAMSHYSEKIRWSLDHLTLPYREVCMTPLFHIVPALKMGGRKQTTVPILVTPEASIQDSARILGWLEEHHGPLDLIPPDIHDEVQAVEARFNKIGRDVARFLYAAGFGEGDDYIIKLWTDHASKAQAFVIRHTYPAIKWSFKRQLKINEAGIARARKRIGDEITWLEQRLDEGHAFLAGDRFTVADITAASLLAPLACPDEHPVYREPQYKSTMGDAIEAWRDSTALQWVRDLYKQHRGEIKIQ
ncbi:glutathione S-transferase family protein [Allohahella marinimesophila]|uniref:GST N-terminal domain-containing protein n=1 Tax=Allohahella marinimesophila TaxID=1054972 RepID=A0ABP7NZX5_9GAMM